MDTRRDDMSAGNPPPTTEPLLTSDAIRPDEVSSALRRAAYLPLFSTHDPDRRNVPIPSPRVANALIGMKVFERMHRFDIQVERSANGRGLRATNMIGEAVASIEIDWRVIPDDFVAVSGVLPPPTELDIRRSQRFAMYDGRFRFNDAWRSGFRGFGAGRTFPQTVDGNPQLWLGAVVEIVEGFGALKGLQGNAVVNGFITPPSDLALSIVVRVVDPRGRLQMRSLASALHPVPIPDPTATFLAFLGEADPCRPITLNVTPEGRVLGARVYERLRFVRLFFDSGGSNGLRAGGLDGSIAGSLSFDLKFDSQDPRIPTPFQTKNATFTFFDRHGTTLGTVDADVVEGRGFQTALLGAPQPVIRVVGFGPIRNGSGHFHHISGMLSVNGCISIPARAPSILYVLRIADPTGRFRSGWSRACTKDDR
jgi:hypothetical protein